MTPIKQILSHWPSLYAASKELDKNQVQLKRWLDAGAMIDDDGNVWIKTGKPLVKPVK